VLTFDFLVVEGKSKFNYQYLQAISTWYLQQF